MSSPAETRVAEPAWFRDAVWLGCPVAGALLGWLLRSIAGWVVSLPVFPLKGPFRLLEAIPEPWSTLGALALGGIAGFALAFLWAREMVTVSVTPDLAILERGDGTVRQVERAPVTVVFVEKKKLVLLGGSGEELLREPADLKVSELRQAFVSHGFPWRDEGDPHAEDYRIWVEDHPELPGTANALLRARKRALDKNQREDVAELRAELAKLGVIVRDEKKRQYWRQVAEG